jgi:hypothetical protein
LPHMLRAKFANNGAVWTTAQRIRSSIAVI